MGTTVESVKAELLKKEMKDLLDEFARSMNLRLEFQYDQFASKGVFKLTVEGFSSESPSLVELVNRCDTYAYNWHRAYEKFKLDGDLLGKTIEILSSKQDKVVRYKILGLVSTNKNKKYCVAMLDLDSGKLWTGGVTYVKMGKIIDPQ